MQAKVPPATCFPHNKNAKRILRCWDTHPHTHTEKNRVFFFLTDSKSFGTVSGSDEMSNIVHQCRITSCVVAVVGFLSSLQCYCIKSLLYPVAWHHAPLLTSIIWL